MKRLVIVITIILGIGINVFAQGGGLFGKGETREYSAFREGENNNSLLNLPDAHGKSTDQSAPIGSGALLLIGFGVAYALRKQRKE